MSCDICSSSFAIGGGRIPKVLPCGHTFCLDCIARWLQTSSCCPNCRKIYTNLNPATLPTNYLAVSGGTPSNNMNSSVVVSSSSSSSTSTYRPWRRFPWGQVAIQLFAASAVTALVMNKPTPESFLKKWSTVELVFKPMLYSIEYHDCLLCSFVMLKNKITAKFAPSIYFGIMGMWFKFSDPLRNVQM